MAKRWEIHAGPRLQQMPGFRHAYFSGDITQNTTAAVSLWDEHPDTEALRQLVQDIAADALARIVPRPQRHLVQLGVEPACQGQGLGRALLGELLAGAAGAGVPLCLETAAPANVPFYRGAGMELVAEGAARGDQPAWWAFSTAKRADMEVSSGR